MTSIFSRIVRGELPAAKIYEDDTTMAFLDINPQARGHTLVICKDEYPGFLELPPELVAAVAQTAQRVARAIMIALKPDGFNLVQNNGAAAGQIIFHYHVHIIPRWEGDRAERSQRPKGMDVEALQMLAVEIRTHIDTNR